MRDMLKLTLNLAKKFLAVIWLVLISIHPSIARSEPLSRERAEARQWYQDAKFGVFLHWGLYSLLGGAGEDGLATWVMNNKKIPIEKYERLADFFNPTAFDAEEWAGIFAQAGANYVVFTAKHHDGFAMYDSKISDFDIVDSTPFGRDVVAELKAALDKRGIKLFHYYAQLDWRHPDYFPRGRFGHDYTGRDESVGDWNKYLAYQNGQIKELLTQYGEAAGIWLTGWLDRAYLPNQGDWNLQNTYKMVREIQPNAIISNNHHLAPFPNEDTQLFERDLPGECSFFFCTTDMGSGVAYEVVETMYKSSWGFHLTEGSGDKDTRALIQMMVKAAGYDANFTLNTGPMPNGKLDPEHVRRYLEIGQWLKLNGESIYKTRGGPLTVRPWGATTQTDKTVYVHILDNQDSVLNINFPADQKIAVARYLSTGKLVPFIQKNDFLRLELDSLELQKLQSEIPDLIVKLTLQ